jgi:2-haloacid dehalogenase
MAARPLIVFDVNETLLDLQTMEPIFERIFGERQAMRLWFANFNHVFRGLDRGRLLCAVH